MPIRVLVVCKGNICRSPFAAAWICIAAKQRPGCQLHCRSAGTENYHNGNGADTLAVVVAREYGVDLSDHLAHQVAADDLDWSDLLLIMDNENLSRLKERFPKQLNKKTILLLGHQLGEDIDIPDPYGKGLEAFRDSFAMITTASESLFKVLATFDDKS